MWKFLLGTAIGGVVIYLIVNNKNKTASNTQQQTQLILATQQEQSDDDWFTAYMANKQRRVQEAIDAGIDPWTLPIQ